MTEEFKPRLEPGQKVYFTDRHELDVVDGEVIQWLGSDSLYGDRYSVFSEPRGEFYDVWEDDLTPWPDQPSNPLSGFAFLLMISLAVIAVRWLQ